MNSANKQDTATVAQMALHSTLWTTLGNYAVQIIGFISVLWLTRLLPPEIFGVLSLASFWTGLLNLRNKLGLNYAAVQHDADGRLLGTFLVLDGLAILISFGLISIAGIVMVSAGIYTSLVAWVMIGMSGIELALCWSSPFGIAIERALLLSRSSLVMIGATIVGYGIGIMLALNGTGIWSMVAIPAINFTIMSIGAIYICWQFLPHIFKTRWYFDRALAISLLKQGSATGLSTALLGIIVAQFDNFLIGTFVNAQTLGYYDRAYKIAGWVNLILTIVVSRIGYLTMVRVADDPARLAHTVRLSIWVVLTLGIPLALVSSFGANDLTQVLYGTTYSQSADYLKVLAITNLMWTLISIAFWLSVARKQRRINLLMSSAHAITLVLLALPLTIAYGVSGTLIGVVIAMLLALIWSTIYIAHESKLGWRETYSAHLTASIVTICVLTILSNNSTVHTWPSPIRLFVMGATSGGAFGICLFTLRKNEIIERFDYLKARWKGA